MKLAKEAFVSSGNRRENQVDLERLTVDGRPLVRRSEDLNAMTLDEPDAGLYRREMSTPRSTYDPFQANFGEVSLAEGLRSKHSKHRQRVWAWLLLVLPSAFLGCLGTLQAWDDVTFGESGYLKAALGAVFWWLPTAFWLLVMYRRPAATSKHT
ncbi:hypothetical protein [Dyella koreensis]|uniref:DUF805 domain-containing protein n=1 Tax=Dyella koreensis TaxID=311235 RepID=A0ABW8K7M5_9GAMM